MNEQNMITQTEAARILGVSLDAVRRMSRTLPGFPKKIRLNVITVRFNEQEIREWARMRDLVLGKSARRSRSKKESTKP